MGAREMSNAAKKYLLTINGNEALMKRIETLESTAGNRIKELEEQLAEARSAAMVTSKDDPDLNEAPRTKAPLRRR